MGHFSIGPLAMGLQSVGAGHGAAAGGKLAALQTRLEALTKELGANAQDDPRVLSLQSHIARAEGFAAGLSGARTPAAGNAPVAPFGGQLDRRQDLSFGEKSAKYGEQATAYTAYLQAASTILPAGAPQGRRPIASATPGNGTRGSAPSGRYMNLADLQPAAAQRRAAQLLASPARQAAPSVASAPAAASISAALLPRFGRAVSSSVAGTAGRQASFAGGLGQAQTGFANEMEGLAFLASMGGSNAALAEKQYEELRQANNKYMASLGELVG